jgi:hypothetical protein
MPTEYMTGMNENVFVITLQTVRPRKRRRGRRTGGQAIAQRSPPA